MNSLLETAENNGVDIFLSILILVVMGGLIFLLIWGIRRDKIKLEMQKKHGDSGVEIEDFMSMVKQKCQRATSSFSVWQIFISEHTNMIESYGQAQYQRAFEDVMQRVRKSLPTSTKYNIRDDGNVFFLYQGKDGEEIIKQVATSLIIQFNHGARLSESMTITFDVNIAVVAHNESNNTPAQIFENLNYSIAQSQRSGINQYYVHAPDITNKESEEYKTYIEIKSAIENKEFLLYYQPMKDLVTDDTFGFESLLRWNHRTMGVLPPSTFLNILDTSGDINWVGLWAFEQLLRQHSAWKKYFPDTELVLSMNLSAKQLMNANLVKELIHVTKKGKTIAGEIAFEIAEFAFLQTGVVAENIEKLAQAGFKISVDNYGMAMNVTALDKFNIDSIKLERQFVNNALGDEEESATAKDTLKLVVSYAARRNIKIIAEGIETEENKAQIRELGIRYGQGYLFGKPDQPDNIKIFD